MPDLLDRTREALRRLRAWHRVQPWERPSPDDGGETCPFCGSPLVEVTSEVPVYPHDSDTHHEPLLELRRCGGCGRYQTGDRRRAA